MGWLEGGSRAGLMYAVVSTFGNSSPALHLSGLLLADVLSLSQQETTLECYTRRLNTHKHGVSFGVLDFIFIVIIAIDHQQRVGTA